MSINSICTAPHKIDREEANNSIINNYRIKQHLAIISGERHKSQSSALNKHLEIFSQSKRNQFQPIKLTLLYIKLNLTSCSG